MSDRILERGPVVVRYWRGIGRAPRPRGAARPRFCAGLAIFALYLQLFAAALCGSTFAQSLAAPAAFPICHTPAGGRAPDQAPHQDHRTCPFCTVHCKAAAVLSPSIGTPERFVAVPARVEPARFLVPARLRFAIGARPRGPPASA